MKTTIDNNQRVFILQAIGWSTNKYVCNLADLVECAKQFEASQPYHIYEIWNNKLHKLTMRKVKELLEANQLDSSFFLGYKRNKLTADEINEDTAYYAAHLARF